MEIPEKVLKKLKTIENKKLEAQESKLREASKWQKKMDGLNALRRERAEELKAYEKFIVEWLSDFLNSSTAERIFIAINNSTLCLFGDNFWQGFPQSGDKTVFATIVVSGGSSNGRTLYLERYKGHPAHETHLGHVFDDHGFRPMTFVKDLHPDFLKSFYECLKSGKVWEIIEGQLRI